MDFESYSRYLFFIRLHTCFVHNRLPVHRRVNEPLRQNLQYSIDDKCTPICLKCGTVLSEKDLHRLEIELLKRTDINFDSKHTEIGDDRFFDRQRVSRYTWSYRRSRRSRCLSYDEWFSEMWNFECQDRRNFNRRRVKDQTEKRYIDWLNAVASSVEELKDCI